MSHYIVKSDSGDYMYNRRSTDSMYVNRTHWGPNLDEARVFTTKSAAVVSANHACGHSGIYRKDLEKTFSYKVYEVELVLK